MSLFLLLLAFALTFAATGWIRTHAKRVGLIDIPNHRSAHLHPVPRGGGLAFVATFYLLMGVSALSGRVDPLLMRMLLPGLLIAAVSLLDDIRTLGPLVRLVVQALAVAATLGIYGDALRLEFGFFSLEGWGAEAVAFLGMLWCVNLYNFLDGIDGYAASETLFLGVAGGLLFHSFPLLLLAASVGGFLPYNWPKASIFMGDVGSATLGFIVGVMILYYQDQSAAMIIWLVLGGLFWFDATYTLLRRLLRRERLSQAHQKHLFQRLVRSGWNHRRVVLAAMGMNLLFALALFGLHTPVALWGLLGIQMALLLWIAAWIGRRIPFGGGR